MNIDFLKRKVIVFIAPLLAHLINTAVYCFGEFSLMFLKHHNKRVPLINGSSCSYPLWYIMANYSLIPLLLRYLNK